MDIAPASRCWPSQLRRMYVDVGERNDPTEVHLAFTGADNKLGSVVATPIEMFWSRDVSEDIANAVLDQAYDADDTLFGRHEALHR
jgi:hypothetical protein